MKIALAQLNYTIGDIEGNARKVLEAIQRAKNERADLVLFAEYALSGTPAYDLLRKTTFLTMCEEALEAQAEAAKAKIDERLLVAYNRIRRSVRNGLAVVTVKRDACGGCFNRIPPQRQVDIRQGKKLIVCEYCGRILVADNEE